MFRHHADHAVQVLDHAFPELNVELGLLLDGRSFTLAGLFFICSNVARIVATWSFTCCKCFFAQLLIEMGMRSVLRSRVCRLPGFALL